MCCLEEIILNACSPSTGAGGSPQQIPPWSANIFAWGKNALFMVESSAEITALLKAWSGGDEAARARLAERVYPELRRMARRYMKNERQGNTLQTTELVHEAYFKLTNQRAVDWENRGQFFAIAAQAMRRLLIDAARQRKSLKRGAEKISLEDAPTIPVEDDQNLLELDRALSELEEFDEQQCRMVELRYFAGLTIDETAEVLRISPSTVKREWEIARTWLYQRMKDQE